MPLGKLSKTQIAKGFECLDEIEKALNANKPRNTLTALSSKFYTLIPHDFGRRIPPAIDDLETLRSKMDMLLVKIIILSCIETFSNKRYDINRYSAVLQMYVHEFTQSSILDCHGFELNKFITQMSVKYQNL